MRTRESNKGVRSIYLINGTGSKADCGTAREHLSGTSRRVYYKPELCRDELTCSLCPALHKGMCSHVCMDGIAYISISLQGFP